MRRARPRLTPPSRRLFASLGLASLLSLAWTACKPAAAPEAPPSADEPAVPVALTTAIFVRHGEKAADDPRDPSLSPAGEARAQALADLLARAGVTHLFASEYRRTQATLRPLADASDLQITVLPAAAPQELVAALRALPAGAVAVVAGHSNTVPALIGALGGQVRDTVDAGGQPALPDGAYDRLFFVTLPAAPASGPTQTLELRYHPNTPTP
ncbi:Histidine phosphatase superfamily (branch 1) [Nannocystis exedens]|uniref:Histidine phosphatase superfamily (Branch 1) n=1 Tax=Nannocystis exedens TaxID=54 RepID=A0A1I2GZU0_9BACT|nr:phosphoglycerate mutase family protein [Nannocystis exedens]PCC68903.1 Histidine phosphatase superfamily (branch 1) [Nannocystis exedens]SFF22066.1 Histidine phosphatase superfamily (branch 1) [Nannocystis exedens]